MFNLKSDSVDSDLEKRAKVYDNISDNLKTMHIPELSHILKTQTLANFNSVHLKASNL